MGEARRPQLYVFGEIEGACASANFRELSCSWRIVYGEPWEVLQGTANGETFTAHAQFIQPWFCWNHPVQLHFVTRAVEGWPKLELTVYGVDVHGRAQIAGYGVQPLPTGAGAHDLCVSCWRPSGATYRERLRNIFLGVVSGLPGGRAPADKELDRAGLQTQHVADVRVRLSMLQQDWDKNGVELS